MAGRVENLKPWKPGQSGNPGLGWIRACRREFSYLRLAGRIESSAIDGAINSFENALADGSWVERERVVRLCETFRMHTKAQDSPELVENIGVQVDNLIWDKLERAEVADLAALDDHQRESLCTAVAEVLAQGFNTNLIPNAVMERRWPEAYEVLAMREGWIYRDWQGAIGDMMLRTSQGENRKFEIIGYGEFELLYSSGDENQKRCFARLSDVFDDVDLAIEDRFDARPRQLRAMARANATLLLALHRAQGAQSIVSKNTIDIAEKILTECRG